MVLDFLKVRNSSLATEYSIDPFSQLRGPVYFRNSISRVGISVSARSTVTRNPVLLLPGEIIDI